MTDDSSVVPDSIGEYRLVRELGRGGMGIVYEAEQPGLGRRVALKVLPPRASSDGRELERFRREARAVGRLHHTHVATVHGTVSDGERHALVMELVDGRGLDDVIRELRLQRQVDAGDETSRPDTLAADVAHGMLTGTWTRDVEGPADEQPLESPPPAGRSVPLSEAGATAGSAFHRAVARVGLQVAEALAHAHERGVLHRDVKPSNVLVDLRGHAWVTDFGIAKLEEDAEELTRAGELVPVQKLSPAV